jgi:hypothetical protein
VAAAAPRTRRRARLASWAAAFGERPTGPATRRIDGIALLLGVADVATSKRFYLDRGFAVAKS